MQSLRSAIVSNRAPWLLQHRKAPPHLHHVLDEARGVRQDILPHLEYQLVVNLQGSQ